MHINIEVSLYISKHTTHKRTLLSIFELVSQNKPIFVNFANSVHGNLMPDGYENAPISPVIRLYLQKSENDVL